MASLTDVGESLALNRLFDAAATTLALFTTSPGEAGGGVEVSATGTGYVRQNITWDPASNGVKANSAAITFPVATASYGTVTSVAIFEGTTMLAYGLLSASKAIDVGDSLLIPINGLSVTAS